MTRDDIDAFFAHRAALDAEAYVELDFTFECVGDPRAAAAHLASEQSTAQWKRVGIDEERLHALTGIDPWFLAQMRAILDTEAKLAAGQQIRVRQCTRIDRPAIQPGHCHTVGMARAPRATNQQRLAAIQCQAG